MEKGDPGDWKKNEKESNEAKEAQGKRKGIVREARRATCFLVQGHIVHRVHDDTLATSRAQHFFGCIFVTQKKKKKAICAAANATFVCPALTSAYPVYHSVNKRYKRNSQC